MFGELMLALKTNEFVLRGDDIPSGDWDCDRVSPGSNEIMERRTTRKNY